MHKPSTLHHSTSLEMQKTHRLFVFTYTYLTDGLGKGRQEGNFSPIRLLGIVFLRLEVFEL